MYKKFISSKNEDIALYIQCNCGCEIIKIYYYRPTTTCSEIIMLDYIGDIQNKKLYKYKYLDMSQSSFYNLVNALKRCEKSGPYTYELVENQRHLVISKNNEFTKLELYYHGSLSKPKKVWDITIHDIELIEVNIELEAMKNKYEVINNVKRSNQ